MSRVIPTAALLLALAGVAHAQQPFATTKVDGTDNVYVFRYQGHQSIFVVTPEGVIATDPISENRPAAEAYVAEIRKVTSAPIRYLIYSHHHPDHTINIALFPNAEVVDFWARYIGDQWLDMPGDGYHLSPNAELWLTPGHTDEDASLIVHADDGVYAMTHLWWHADRGPEIDPYADDQDAINAGRQRVLAVADVVIPGHGGPFRVER